MTLIFVVYWCVSVVALHEARWLVGEWTRETIEEEETAARENVEQEAKQRALLKSNSSSGRRARSKEN